MNVRFRRWVGLAAILTALVFAAGHADARVGGGKSFGSRGMRTWSAPPSTTTAPNVNSINRSMTQQPSAATTGARAQGAPGGFLNRPGLLGGLAAGFLGAGLFGMLFGHGFLAGLGSFAGLLGLLLQIGLVVIVARLFWTWFVRRNQPATASGPSLRHVYGEAPDKGAVDIGAKTGSGFFVPAKLDLTAQDFDQFEKLLGDVQSAYSSEDLTALRTLVTPEMLSYLSEQFAENAMRGVQNRISGVKLEQGDLSEAWSEDGAEYATVAMRFSLIDKLFDRKTGAVVEGDDTPQQVTEVWTFRRAPRGAWMLSAIQQA
jgi:predicted lipid-binding transport protein (Tim44 family)